MNNHKALILAAGRGSRMGDHTTNSHKALTRISGKTLLEWQINSLKLSNIDKITVVRGYNSQMLKGDFYTIENNRWMETNMVYSFFCAPEFDCKTIVSYSDITYSSEHVKKLIEHKGDIIITADKSWYNLWSLRFEDPFLDAETLKTNENNHLTEIGGKSNSLSEIEAQYMGLLKFSPKGWHIAFELFNSLDLEQRDKLDMTTFLSILKDRIDINVLFVDGKWCEVDTYSDLLIYKNKLKEKKEWNHDWRI